MQLLRHQSDHRSGSAVVAGDVMAADGNGAFAGTDQAADGANQRRLPRAVRAEQRENLAGANIEVDILQRREARGIGLRKVFDRDDGGHGCDLQRREHDIGARTPSRNI
jgi:hypothetical protein